MNTPQYYAERLKTIVKQLEFGCGNHGCCIKQPIGQATNGPCRCQPHRITAEILEVAVKMDKQTRWPK